MRAAESCEHVSIGLKIRALDTPESQRRQARALDLTQRLAIELTAANDGDLTLRAAKAERQLQDNRSIRPGVFSDPDRQRAFSEAWCVLDQLSRNARLDSRISAELDELATLGRERDALRAGLGPDPQATLARLRSEVSATQQKVFWSYLRAGAPLLPALFLIVPGVLLRAETPALWALASALFALAVWPLVRLLRARRLLGRLTGELELTSARCAKLRAFEADPERGERLAALSLTSRRPPEKSGVVSIAPRG